MFRLKLPARLNPLNRRWTGLTGTNDNQIWPYSEITVDKYNPTAHFSDLHEAIQWKNQNYPNIYLGIRFGVGEWDLPASTELINAGLYGPGTALGIIRTPGNLSIINPSPDFKILLKDFSIYATGAGTNTCALFIRGNGASAPIYLYDVYADATGGSSETYAYWFYDEITAKMYRCSGAAYAGGAEYCILMQAGPVVDIYGGGPFFGDTAPASVEGTLRLYNLPEVDPTDFVGPGTTTWNWVVDSAANLVAKNPNPSGHWHTKLIPSDGSPDPAFSVDNSGNATAAATLTVVSDLAASANLTVGGNIVADTGYTEVRQLVSKRNISIANNTAVAQQAMAAGNRFLFGCVGNGGEYFFGVCTYNGISTISNSGFSVVAGGGTLSGTTGPNGTINLRDNNGVLYIENRRGASRNVGFTAFGSD